MNTKDAPTTTPTVVPDGSVEMAYGDPVGSAVFAAGAGDYEGLYSEYVPEFELFAWVETPEPPVSK